jgi:hypothetical protein
MAHDTKRKADDAPATYAGLAPDGFEAFGTSLPLGVSEVLLDEPLLDEVLLPANGMRKIAHR